MIYCLLCASIITERIRSEASACSARSHLIQILVRQQMQLSRLEAVLTFAFVENVRLKFPTRVFFRTRHLIPLCVRVFKNPSNEQKTEDRNNPDALSSDSWHAKHDREQQLYVSRSSIFSSSRMWEVYISRSPVNDVVEFMACLTKRLSNLISARINAGIVQAVNKAIISRVPPDKLSWSF